MLIRLNRVHLKIHGRSFCENCLEEQRSAKNIPPIVDGVLIEADLEWTDQNF